MMVFMMFGWMEAVSLMLLLFALATTKALRLSPKQYNALQLLYDSTEGLNWVYPSDGQSVPWNFSDPSSDPCEDHWSGVACRNASSSTSTSCCSSVAATNEVIQLDLSMHHLAGFIPECFATNMTSLEVMDLHDNDLTGTIPSELGRLSSLKELYLSENDLSGSLPSIFGNFSDLQYLNVSFNRFTGQIPSTLYHLSSLVQMSMQSNLFTGSIVVPSSEGLELVDVSDNKFTESLPSNLPETAPILSTLDASRNCLSLEIPVNLCDLSNLTTLVLNGIP